MPTSRNFAVIPAAGLSRRMGTSKLLLKWQGKPLIEHTLEAWQNAGVSEVVVIIRREENQLQQICKEAGSTVLVADCPSDMRASVQMGLDWLAEKAAPQPQDSWLLSPADTPRITTPQISQVLNSRWVESEQIQVACFQGKRGHPVRFRWELAKQVRSLPPNTGINALLKEFPLREIECDSSVVCEDIDTPSDFEKLNERK